MENSKDPNDKGFFWGYIMIACVAILGGIFSIYSRINGIDDYLFALDPTPGPVITESQIRLQALAVKKLEDSDGDSINDFDELYSYKTSAYLADSDSDGASDSVEITNGTDPNCATGKTCFTTSPTNANSANSNVEEAADVTQLSTEDPQALREQLIKLGIDETVLSQVSDADLVEIYGSVQQDYQTTTTNEDPYADLLPDTTNANSVTSIRTYEDLQNLGPDAIRSLLLQSGMSSEDLAQIDDDTLMQLYADTLAQAGTQ